MAGRACVWRRPSVVTAAVPSRLPCSLPNAQLMRNHASIWPCSPWMWHSRPSSKSRLTCAAIWPMLTSRQWAGWRSCVWTTCPLCASTTRCKLNVEGGSFHTELLVSSVARHEQLLQSLCCLSSGRWHAVLTMLSAHPFCTLPPQPRGRAVRHFQPGVRPGAAASADRDLQLPAGAQGGRHDSAGAAVC